MQEQSFREQESREEGWRAAGRLSGVASGLDLEEQASIRLVEGGSALLSRLDKLMGRPSSPVRIKTSNSLFPEGICLDRE